MFVFGFKTSWDLLLLAFEAASTPAQVAVGGLGMLGAVAGVGYGGRGGLRAIGNYQNAGAEVPLPGGGTGYFSRIVCGGIECFTADGTIVTLRGDDARKAVEGNLERNPEKRDEIRKEIARLRKGSTGERKYTRISWDDDEAAFLADANRGLQREKGELADKFSKAKAMFAELKEDFEASSTPVPETSEASSPEAPAPEAELNTATPVDAVTPPTPALDTEAIKAKVLAKTEVAESPEAAVEAAQELIGDAIDAGAEMVAATKALADDEPLTSTEAMEATPDAIPATEASAPAEVKEEGKPQAEEAAS